MTVKMNRVGHWNESLDDEIVPFISIVKFNDIGGIGPSSVVVVDLKDGRIAPINFERDSVESPSEKVLGVEGDENVFLARRGA